MIMTTIYIRPVYEYMLHVEIHCTCHLLILWPFPWDSYWPFCSPPVPPSLLYEAAVENPPLTPGLLGDLVMKRVG